MAKASEDCFFNIEQILCEMNTEKWSLFAATLSINSEQIKNKSRRELKYVITKTLEEKLDDEKRTQEQKCEVFENFLEDLNYYNDETNTGNTNQPKEDSTKKHGDTTRIDEYDQTNRGNEICHHSYVSWIKGQVYFVRSWKLKVKLVRHTRKTN